MKFSPYKTLRRYSLANRVRKKIAASGFFDAVFYRTNYMRDLAQDPIDHYIETGSGLGYWPSPDFDPQLYLDLYPDLAEVDGLLLLHFIEFGQKEGRRKPDQAAKIYYEISSSGLFDANYYRAMYLGVKPVADRKKIAASSFFDAIFYRTNYMGDSAQDPIDHYIELGSGLGYWPSPDFDPQLYLDLYPDLAELDGLLLLHFIQCGQKEGRRRPDQAARIYYEISSSGLFDANYYRARYLGVKPVVDPLDHFIKEGSDLGHFPSAGFDPQLYLDLYPDLASFGQSLLIHFIRYGQKEGKRQPDQKARTYLAIAKSDLFDAVLYIQIYPEVARAGIDPLDHYLTQGHEAHRPSMEFDGAAYLEGNPDLQDTSINPLKHYVEFGKAEGRLLPAVPYDRNGLAEARAKIQKSGLFDVAFYLSENPVVRHSGTNPLLHYLIFGFKSLHEPSPGFSQRAYIADYLYLNIDGIRMNPLLHYVETGRYKKSLLRQSDVANEEAIYNVSPSLQYEVWLERAAAMSFFARYGFTFESSGPSGYAQDCIAVLASREASLFVETKTPDVSIIIPIHGQLPFVLSCLDSLSTHTSRYSVEIIVNDDVSPDEKSMARLGAIPWIRYIRRSANGGFIDCCNSAAAAACGRYLIFLNSDTRLVHGWLDELIGSFDTFPKAGMVGSKLLNADGSLQEAGGLYWSDGTAWNYGRNQDPNHPKYCFARQVDYVSGASIAIPTAIWREVGGFNEAYRPAYCEDVDLAFRLRERGYEVWYQSMSCVIHYEGMTHGRDSTSGIKAYQVANLKRLQSDWGPRLMGKRRGGEEPDLEANRLVTKRMLVIDALTHSPDKDAGSLVASQMMRAFRELGYWQSFMPFLGVAIRQPYTSANQRVGVEALYAPFICSIEDVFRHRSNYDYVLIYRYGVGSATIAAIRAAMPTARIIFSNVDLHYLRLQREAELANDKGGKFHAEAVKHDELCVFASVDCSLVHTPIEKQVVEAEMPVPLGNVMVFPWIANTKPSGRTFIDRRHLMFLGGFDHPPNGDAVEFFMDKIWPLLAAKLPEDTKFLIVGNKPTGRIRAMGSDRVVVTGYVADLEPYFADARVFVAPLRFGAGIKGKLIESLAHGVPSVVTSIAAEGIGLVDGQQCAIADHPGVFADAVLRLFESPDEWQAMQTAGYRFVEDNFSWSRALDLCREALDVADATWLRREANLRKNHLRSVLQETGLIGSLSDEPS